MGRCSTSPAQAQISKPCHLISFLGTLHPPNICRANCAALVFFSCRVARSLAPSSLHSVSSLGAHSPPVYHPGHGDVTSPFTPRSRPRRHSGHVPRPGPARATWQPPPPAAARLLAHPAPALDPQRDRPGRNASPQDLEPITVRLPWGTGHGKGPRSAQADLVSDVP